MCGISGIFGKSNTLNNDTFQLNTTIHEMNNTLRHRGPDDSGVWIDQDAGIALGHMRLAVLDLSQDGHQPMFSCCGRYVGVYNGEIYNFWELRKELEQVGCSFRGTSDTEVMLNAISKWGIHKALKCFNGMFAFAVWDQKERMLTLARDRIGQKPLYYGWAGKALVFASELKAIRKHPDFAGEVDRGSLALFLKYNYVPAPYSIYQDIYKLPPGKLLSVTLDQISEKIDLNTKIETYWSADTVVQSCAANPFCGDETEAIDTLDDLLSDSVKIRMISDVPIGVLLSGGIDSSTVTSLMQSHDSSPVKTFCVDFDRSDKKGIKEARDIGSFLGTEHTEICVSGREALNVIPSLPLVYDEPFADSSQIPTILVAELAKKQVTVALSGDGGDELFFGYNRYFRNTSIWKTTRIFPRVLREILGNFLRAYSGNGIIRTNSAKLANDITSEDALALYQSRVSKWIMPQYLVKNSLLPPLPFLQAVKNMGLPGVEHNMMLYDLVSYLPDDILVKVDRASMAVGLELRNPILDYRVVEFAWQLPLQLKWRNGKGKYVLRKVLERYVPNRLINTQKRGFGSPIREWLRDPLREWAEELLDKDRLRREGFFDPESICLMWSKFRNHNQKFHSHLWNVLMFQAWLDSQTGDISYRQRR